MKTIDYLKDLYWLLRKIRRQIQDKYHNILSLKSNAWNYLYIPRGLWRFPQRNGHRIAGVFSVEEIILCRFRKSWRRQWNISSLIKTVKYIKWMYFNLNSPTTLPGHEPFSCGSLWWFSEKKRETLKKLLWCHKFKIRQSFSKIISRTKERKWNSDQSVYR